MFFRSYRRLSTSRPPDNREGSMPNIWRNAALKWAELERVLIYAVRDGQLSECWVYDADPALVARFVGN